MSALSIRGISAAYGTTPVLHGLDLEVQAGSLTAILGPSGSGKTTLLRVIAGFERPTAGTVSLGDQLLEGPGKHLPPERRNLGYVAQDGALFPHLTVARNVAFGLKRKGSRRTRVLELLELVGLADLPARYPHELSGGQQQRVALARALAAEPPIVLLDEPFAALDASLRNDVRRDISRILREAGTTTILVTHDQDEALSMADQVAVLRGGRVVQAAAPDVLYRQPHDAELAQFLGAANILSATASATGFDSALGALTGPALLPGTAASIMLRPEQLVLAPEGTPATVLSVEYHGHDAVLSVLAHCRTGGDLPLIVRATPHPDLGERSEIRLAVVGPVHAWRL